MSFFYVLDQRAELLVADDDPIMREFASVYLSSPVAEVVTVANGAEALAAIQPGRFDILLLDLDMPVMNGFQVLENLRSIPATATLPVIVITGREDMVSIDRAYELGATSFVIKPVNWRLLAYQVKYVLRGARALQSRSDPLPLINAA